MIIQVSDNIFELTRGNHKMTLTKDESGWYMLTDNPSVRAWNSMGFSRFFSLEEVEKKYKSWRGISILINVNA